MQSRRDPPQARLGLGHMPGCPGMLSASDQVRIQEAHGATYLSLPNFDISPTNSQALLSLVALNRELGVLQLCF